MMMVVTAVVAAALLPSFASAQGDFIHFSYTGYQEPQYFSMYEDLLGDEVLKRCVRREYPPEDGGSCRDRRKVCLWGKQRCADGDLEPTTRCNCHDDSWGCQSFFCPTLDAVCPATDPSALDPMEVICKTDMKCDYGEANCDFCDNIPVPTVTCSCQAGQPLTCRPVDVCTESAADNCFELDRAKKDKDYYPNPTILEFKMEKEKPPSEIVEEEPAMQDPNEIDSTIVKKAPSTTSTNPEGCPADEPFPTNSTDLTCGTGSSLDNYECDYGYSCCCPDGSECSSDLKCDCNVTTGVLTCHAKTCAAFNCIPPPELLESPFTADPHDNNGLCPAYETAAALHADEGQNATSCNVDDQYAFYTCEYGFYCCCPDDETDIFNYNGRYCSSELQCSCSAGVFTCDARECPACGVAVVEPDGSTTTEVTEAPKILCPETQPNHDDKCTIDGGDTCGYDEITCCDGSKHANFYCKCVPGTWDCFDATYLCDAMSCDTTTAVTPP
eukprot:CAMPEP_0119013700 /NCGR_PEP_ID=MMETSP1176-20130426/8785_1 /TAXON_ID=265551 /ORGANISM="Synedropsis recta cf, Strain CCMP1620" /LENGTH=497 /DNA_ID=CAMNT_0006966809 /DNA_START=104 /DNA_END=1597 /DNA_ORIENTATION=+